MTTRLEMTATHRRNLVGILRSPTVAANLRGRAQRVAAAAGPGHRVDSQIGMNRARASVITDTIPAMIREGRDRNLTRAFDAARG